MRERRVDDGVLPLAGRPTTDDRRPAGASLEPPVVASALTRIFPFRYIRYVESSFAIIAEPNRRAILSLLASSERSVGEIERQLRMPQPSVSKHLRVLRDAGFVEARVEAQRRVYAIRPQPLMEVDAWLAPFRRFWTTHVDALERHLDRMAQAAAQGGKAKTEKKGKSR
jgi:DNA-binding transcriptional ArsR family regulator